MAVYVQTNQVVNIPNQPAYNVLESDTGKIHSCPQTTLVVGDITITLPPVAPGLYYRFINSSPAAAVANVIIKGNVAGLINGLAIDFTNGIIMANSTNIKFVSAKSVKGDYIELICDGVIWSCFGRSSVLDGIE